MTSPLQQLKIERSAAPQIRRRWIKPLIIGLAVLIALGLGMLFLSQRPTEVNTVRVTQAWPAQAITLLNATGYVSADRKASVATKGTGRLEWIGVREGSVVKAGEVIARLENSDMQALLAQARANVEVTRARQAQAEADSVDAQYNLRRQQALAARNFVSPAAVDAAHSRYQQTVSAVAAQVATVKMMQAAVRNAEASLDNTIIRAPFSGVVLTKQANVGDIVAPFSTNADSKGAVITLADLTTLEVEADVSETNLAKARVGQACEIQLDALPNLRLAGSVQRIVPTVDRSKATVKFKIKFEESDPRILPDMSAKIAFLERPLRADERAPRLAVQQDAIRDGRAFVIQANGQIEERSVLIGEKIGDLIEIKSGLSNNETVVLKPADKLRAGMQVVEKKP